MKKEEFVGYMEAELGLVKAVLTGELGEEAENNPYIKNAGAFHAEHVIEFCLKYFLEINGALNEDLELTQDISMLLNKAESIQPGFISNHPYIAEHAEELSKYEELEEGVRLIGDEEGRIVYERAVELFDEMKKY